DTIVGYSAALRAGTVGNVSVRVNERSEIDYTMLANAQGFRDILVAASVFANDNLYPLSDVYASPYTPGDPVLTDENGNPLNGVPGATLEEQKANFFQLLTSVREMVTKAQSSINELKFGLSTAQARISEIETGNRQEKAVLDTIVSENEDVDINTVAVRL